MTALRRIAALALVILLVLSVCAASEKETTLRIDALDPVETQYTNHDIFFDMLQMAEKNHLLVVYVSFQGEPELDRQAFEALFTAECEANQCLRSVQSYFTLNSYGLDLLDFTFAYYDCGMTVEQAWHYVNDMDARGDFKGNRFLYEIFEELKVSGRIDPSSLDADGNGYVDATLFIIGDRPNVDDCYIYGGAQGHTNRNEYQPNPDNPALGNYIKMSADFLNQPLEEASFNHEGTRMVIHEIGHLFGLMDYYDFMPYQDQILDSLGGYDMQSSDNGDWNPFSKFLCGWLKPYVITEEVDSVTVKLRCSSLYNEAILIPTSEGWNGTAYDEYILVDVMAPAGANYFDWKILTENAWRNDNDIKNDKGGVRILHVDARLLKQVGDGYARIEHVEEAIDPNVNVLFAFTNSNGYEPYLSEDSNFYHQVDWIPVDGSSKFRLSAPTNWSAFAFASTNDLFGAGDTFSTETHQAAFVNGERMNNGGTLDYEVRVESYDAKLQEAVVTVSRIR